MHVGLEDLPLLPLDSLVEGLGLDLRHVAEGAGLLLKLRRRAVDELLAMAMARSTRPDDVLDLTIELLALIESGIRVDVRRHELLLLALFSLDLLHLNPLVVLLVVLSPNDLLDVNLGLLVSYNARHNNESLVIGEVLLNLTDSDIDLSELLLA